MNGNYAQNITSAIQSNRVFETSIDPELINQNWTTVVNMIDSHPNDLVKREPNKNRIMLNDLHQRQSVKPIVKQIISLFQDICPGKTITNIAFMGFGKHESYPLTLRKPNLWFSIGEISLSNHQYWRIPH